jgi:transposase
VLFHQDNAPPHRVALVHQFFDDNHFEVVPHAPYSPDLTPLMNFNGFHATQVEESRAALRM